ncbi:(d)CMP kinase [bacterium]|nr:(d)CMP kinase [bacterium]
MARKLTIAIDGPAGAGKSTLAKLVAKRLGYSYLESGLLYRTLTYEALRKGIDFKNEETLIGLASELKIAIKELDGEWHIFLKGEDISGKIKTPEIDEKVAQIGKITGVRKEFLKFQRRMARKGGVVVEGRDIGTVVLPEADKKFYIDASLEERTKRKCKEFQEKGYRAVFSKVLKETGGRDLADMTREAGPLKKATDAIRIDTTDLTIEEGIEMVLREIRRREKKWILYSIIHSVGRWFFKFLFRLEVRGKENILKEGPVILASNHLSFLDPLLIGVSSRRRLHYMTLSVVFKLFFIGRLVKKLGTFPVKRQGTNIEATKKALEILKRGEVLLIFIEGRRSPSGDFLEPKPGVGMLAYKSRAAVIPTLIIGSNRALPFNGKFIRPRKIKISFGKPLTIEKFSHLKPKEVYQAMSDEIMNRIKKMQRE